MCCICHPVPSVIGNEQLDPTGETGHRQYIWAVRAAVLSSLPMPTLTGQNGRRLLLDLPVATSLEQPSWAFMASLEMESGTVTNGVHEFGDGLVLFFRDLASSWRGWDGEKEYASLEGGLAISATHDGLGTVSLRVQLRQPWPPEWSAEAVLDVGVDADLEAQVRSIDEWVSGK